MSKSLSRRKKLIVIVGHEGQDGRLLWEAASRKEWDVVGIGRRENRATTSVDALQTISLESRQSIDGLLSSLKPDEIYFLAAHHASSEKREIDGSYEDYERSWAVNVCGPTSFLEAIRLHSPESRFFYASSSLVFGPTGDGTLQDEETPLRPLGPYAVSKAAAGRIVTSYRETYGLHASTGILYNHESIYRKPNYVSQKIVLAALRISTGEQERLTLGSLDAVVDWGAATDYVDAFLKILSQDEPDDYVIATGKGHTVRDFVAAAFEPLGLDWNEYVDVNGAVLGGDDRGRIGDASRLRHRTGWQPTMSFAELVEGLVTGAAEWVDTLPGTSIERSAS